MHYIFLIRFRTILSCCASCLRDTLFTRHLLQMGCILSLISKAIFDSNAAILPLQFWWKIWTRLEFHFWMILFPFEFCNGTRKIIWHFLLVEWYEKPRMTVLIRAISYLLTAAVVGAKGKIRDILWAIHYQFLSLWKLLLKLVGYDRFCWCFCFLSDAFVCCCFPVSYILFIMTTPLSVATINSIS